MRRRDGSPCGLAVTWVRIDQGLYVHPKIVAVGPLGTALFIRGLCHCNTNLTDGFISAPIIKSLTWDIDAGADAMTDLLVQARLWEREDGGVRVHDFDKYNPTRLEVLAERERAKSSAVKGGLARAMTARRNADGTMASSRAAGYPLVQPVQPPSSPDPDPVRDRSVVTPTVSRRPRAARSTSRKVKSRKPGSFGRL